MPSVPERMGEWRMLQSGSSDYVKGAAFAIAAVSIWASWSAITRLAVTTSLDTWDVAALRFGVAGLLLVPVVLRRGLALERLGWSGLGVLIAGAGAPYAVLAAGGLRFAPAHDQGALNPGFMPLFVALIASTVLRDKVSRAGWAGLALILAGALAIVGGEADVTALRSLGHAMFLAAAFLWACFTVVMRHAKLDALHATALVSTGSALLYLPIYMTLRGAHLARMPMADLAFQAIFQGALVTIASLLLYGRAIAILGASRGAAFGALVPALSALFAIPLLGEWPSRTDWVGIALISVGVYLASGGALPPPAGRGGHEGRA
jgi:drug/metabolite transporter (DMT)-like permease